MKLLVTPNNKLYYQVNFNTKSNESYKTAQYFHTTIIYNQVDFPQRL